MGLFKSIKKVAGFAAPLAAFVPGLNIYAAMALGGGLGALGGGGLKGALGGAIGAAGLGGGGSLLGNALGAGSGAFGSALGGGILGATGGALSGGGKGALIGGALGGAGGYIQGSGGIGNAFKNLTGNTGGALGGSGGLASSYGPDDYSALSNADKLADNPGIFSQAKDLLSGTTSLGADDYSTLAGNNGMGAAGAISGNAASGSTNYLTPLASAAIGGYTNQKAQGELLDQQQNAFNTLSPFLSSSFDPSNLGSDAGYQFQLAEGNKAIDRAAAARGNYFSGQALTDAADYSKGLTDTTLQDAYNRYSTDQNRKIGVAGGLTNIYDNIGNVNAGATTNLGNIFTGSLAAATGKQGVNSSGQMIGGNNQISSLLAGLTPQQLAQLRAQLG